MSLCGITARQDLDFRAKGGSDAAQKAIEQIPPPVILEPGNQNAGGDSTSVQVGDRELTGRQDQALDASQVKGLRMLVLCVK